MPKFEVLLSATLPATARMTVEADTEQEAREYADQNFREADWSGSDCGDYPAGCDVEVVEVLPIPRYAE